MRTINQKVDVYEVVRTEFVPVNVYEFAELSEDAKRNVREWWSEYRGDVSWLSWQFSDWCNEDLKAMFPNSDLKVEYSLSYSQGDGLNIYGCLCLTDVIEHIKDKFTKDELAYFDKVFADYNDNFNMPSNRYCYCICDSHDYIEDIVSDMECDGDDNINHSAFNKLNDSIREYLTDYCKTWKQQGYEFFYPDIELDGDGYLISDCECNGWEFLEDGTLFED